MMGFPMSICAVFEERGMWLGIDDFFILRLSNVYGEVLGLGVHQGPRPWAI